MPLRSFTGLTLSAQPAFRLPSLSTIWRREIRISYTEEVVALELQSGEASPSDLAIPSDIRKYSEESDEMYSVVGYLEDKYEHMEEVVQANKALRDQNNMLRELVARKEGERVALNRYMERFVRPGTMYINHAFARLKFRDRIRRDLAPIPEEEKPEEETLVHFEMIKKSAGEVETK